MKQPEPHSLHALLRWANKAYREETPELGHAVALTDEGGAPEMKPAVAAYLGLHAKRLLEKDDRPDNWRALAGRRDHDGFYITPLRYAIELCPDPAERRFLRDLVPELYYPSEIAELHGIPRWAAKYVMHPALTRLWHTHQGLMRDQAKGTSRYVGWVSMSDSQRAAIEAGEKDAA
ncbi:MAG: hypothetical protein ACO3RU_13630 [Planctomycetota bacterium]